MRHKGFLPRHHITWATSLSWWTAWDNAECLFVIQTFQSFLEGCSVAWRARIVSSWAMPRFFHGERAGPKAANGLQRPSLGSFAYQRDNCWRLVAADFYWRSTCLNFLSCGWDYNGVCSSSALHSLWTCKNIRLAKIYLRYLLCPLEPPHHLTNSSCGACSQSHPLPPRGLTSVSFQDRSDLHCNSVTADWSPYLAPSNP